MFRRRDKSASDSPSVRASMSVALGLGLGFFVLTSVAGVLGVGLVIGYQNTVDLLRQKSELLVASGRDQTQRFLQAAESQVDFIAEQLISGDAEADGSEEFTSLLLGSLAATPQILRIQYISADFQLTGVERQDFEAVPLFQSVKGDRQLKTLVEKAKSQTEAAWGPLLWRQEYTQAVLNYHHPIIRDEKFVGLVSAFVSIRLLSEFVSDVETEFGANAFILHGPDQVLAHPLMSFGYPGLTRLTPLPKQTAFGDPVIVSMWRAPEEKSLAQRILTGPGVNFVAFGDREFVVLHKKMEGFSDKPLLIGTYFESHDLLAEVGRLKWAIIICLVMSVISAIFAAIIGRQIAQPVRRLAVATRKIHDLDLSNVEPIPGSFFSELDDAARSFNTMLDGLRWFERYVPKRLVQKLIKLDDDEGIQSEYRRVVIMFTDMAGFTSLSEMMSAPEAAEYLNSHFTMVADACESELGTVDKYIGDSVMAIWGAPDRQKDFADRACQAAVKVARAIEADNERRYAADPSEPRARIRIGIHLGRVVVGNIGSPGRVNYTVIGDAVNVAQRLTEIADTIVGIERDVSILMTSAVKDNLNEPLDLHDVGPTPLRGRAEPVELYELRTLSPSKTPHEAALAAPKD